MHQRGRKVLQALAQKLSRRLSTEILQSFAGCRNSSAAWDILLRFGKHFLTPTKRRNPKDELLALIECKFLAPARNATRIKRDHHHHQRPIIPGKLPETQQTLVAEEKQKRNAVLNRTKQKRTFHKSTTSTGWAWRDTTNYRTIYPALRPVFYGIEEEV